MADWIYAACPTQIRNVRRSPSDVLPLGSVHVNARERDRADRRSDRIRKQKQPSRRLSRLNEY
jgi:hypothetical protein